MIYIELKEDVFLFNFQKKMKINQQSRHPLIFTHGLGLARKEKINIGNDELVRSFPRS